MIPSVIYTLWTTYLNYPLIVKKVIFNVFYRAPNFLENKTMVICSRKTAHQLNNDIRNLEMVFFKGGE